MNKERLNSVLEKHKKWLDGEDCGERADLSGANLRYADLSDADLSGADLDYSCWPLWCGGLGATIDDRIARQLLYHILSVIGCSPVSQEIKDAALTPELIEVANALH